MKAGSVDPHHREVQANMSHDTVTSHMRHLLTKVRVSTTATSIGDLSINGACAT